MNKSDKNLRIPFIRALDGKNSLFDIKNTLQKICIPEVISETPWPNFPYLPSAQFRIGWGCREIGIHFEMTENLIKAEQIKDNSPVSEDSCVEFFVSLGDDTYMNFEFNSIGTCLLGRGKDRAHRTHQSSTLISRIRREGSLGQKPFVEREGVFSWEIAIAIPLDLFNGTELNSPEGKTFKANFYKCGEKLSSPHFATWKTIKTETPDFHQPKYFGSICFSNKEEAH